MSHNEERSAFSKLCSLLLPERASLTYNRQLAGKNFRRGVRVTPVPVQVPGRAACARVSSALVCGPRVRPIQMKNLPIVKFGYKRRRRCARTAWGMGARACGTVLHWSGPGQAE